MIGSVLVGSEAMRHALDDLRDRGNSVSAMCIECCPPSTAPGVAAVVSMGDGLEPGAAGLFQWPSCPQAEVLEQIKISMTLQNDESY